MVTLVMLMESKMKYNKNIKIVALTLASFGLTACLQTAQNAPTTGNFNKSQYQRNHPISVTKGLQEIDLVATTNGGGLAPSQMASVAQFVIDYIDKGEGQFEIWIPRSSDNAKSMNVAHQKIRRVLAEAAIPKGALKYHKYDANGNTNAPIGLKFGRYYSKATKCNGINSNLATNHDNKNYNTFGCAYQNNLAAMVSNPKDLLGPAASSSSSAERRQIIWAKYIQGAPTGATRAADEAVAINKGS